MITLPRHRTVADVMTTRVHVASPETPFKLLVRLIEENRISAVPIVDHNGIPVGVVSESDLLFKERRGELTSAPDLLMLPHRVPSTGTGRARYSPRESLTHPAKPDANAILSAGLRVDP